MIIARQNTNRILPTPENGKGTVKALKVTFHFHSYPVSAFKVYLQRRDFNVPSQQAVIKIGQVFEFNLVFGLTDLLPALRAGRDGQCWLMSSETATLHKTNRWIPLFAKFTMR